MKKRIISLALALCLCMSVIPFAAQNVSADSPSPVSINIYAGTFGRIDGESEVYMMKTPGERIGLLPVPVNDTFHNGTFNNMYFEGWELENEPGNIIDESYIVPAHAVNLVACWSEGQGEMGFKDVKTSDWFYDAVKYCYGKNLISGTDSKSFSPAMNCSRAMIVTILYRLDGSLKSSGSNPFSDVAKGKWYYEAVLWAAENGIVSGDGKGHFLPDANVTREQLAQIMKSYASYCGRYNPDDSAMLVGFPDANKVSGWANNAVAWAVGKGFVSGKAQSGKNYLDPQGNATRAEFASILLRYIKAFDGDPNYYYNDLMWVTVPPFWTGNVVCRFDNTENGVMSFYAAKTYYAEEGLSGRLFWLSLRPNGGDHTEDPNFYTLAGALMSETDIIFDICVYKPSDVQCEFPGFSPEAAQYSAMMKGYESFLFDSLYFKFTHGMG